MADLTKDLKCCKDKLSFMENDLDRVLEKMRSDIRIIAQATEIEEALLRKKINLLEEHLQEKINIAQTGVDGLTEMLYETCFETIEERMDNKLEALEKRLNDMRKEMQLKPDCALSIEQKKHICSAVDKWQDNRMHGVCVGESAIENLKSMICDTKIGEFKDE
jgi:hypothetical protein